MIQIIKTTYTFTVLHRADYPPFESIDDAICEATDGHAVGWTTGETHEFVPREQVSAELQELGNDGTFFDDDFADEED